MRIFLLSFVFAAIVLREPIFFPTKLWQLLGAVYLAFLFGMTVWMLDGMYKEGVRIWPRREAD